MYKIKTMNHISPCGLQKLEERGCVVGENIQDPDGLILRSADLHSYASVSYTHLTLPTTERV